MRGALVATTAVLCLVAHLSALHCPTGPKPCPDGTTTCVPTYTMDACQVTPPNGVCVAFQSSTGIIKYCFPVLPSAACQNGWLTPDKSQELKLKLKTAYGELVNFRCCLTDGCEPTITCKVTDIAAGTEKDTQCTGMCLAYRFKSGSLVKECSTYDRSYCDANGLLAKEVLDYTKEQLKKTHPSDEASDFRCCTTRGCNPVPPVETQVTAKPPGPPASATTTLRCPTGPKPCPDGTTTCAPTYTMDACQVTPPNGVCVAFQSSTGIIKYCFPVLPSAACQNGWLTPDKSQELKLKLKTAYGELANFRCCLTDGCEPTITCKATDIATRTETDTQCTGTCIAYQLQRKSNAKSVPVKECSTMDPKYCKMGMLTEDAANNRKTEVKKQLGQGYEVFDFRCCTTSGCNPVPPQSCPQGDAKTQGFQTVAVSTDGSPCRFCVSFDITDSTGAVTFKQCWKANTGFTADICNDNAKLAAFGRDPDNVAEIKSAFSLFPETGALANFRCCSTPGCDPNPSPATTGDKRAVCIDEPHGPADPVLCFGICAAFWSTKENRDIKFCANAGAYDCQNGRMQPADYAFYAINLIGTYGGMNNFRCCVGTCDPTKEVAMGPKAPSITCKVTVQNEDKEENKEEMKHCDGLCIVFDSIAWGPGHKQCMHGRTAAECEHGLLNQAIAKAYTELKKNALGKIDVVRCCAESGCDPPTGVTIPTPAAATPIKCKAGDLKDGGFFDVTVNNRGNPCRACVSYDLQDSTGSVTYKECWSFDGRFTAPVCKNQTKLDAFVHSPDVLGVIKRSFDAFPQGGVITNVRCCSTNNCNPNDSPLNTGNGGTKSAYCHEYDDSKKKFFVKTCPLGLCVAFQALNKQEDVTTCLKPVDASKCKHGTLMPEDYAELAVTMSEKYGGLYNFRCCVKPRPFCDPSTVSTIEHPPSPPSITCKDYREKTSTREEMKHCDGICIVFTGSIVGKSKQCMPGRIAAECEKGFLNKALTTAFAKHHEGEYGKIDFISCCAENECDPPTIECKVTGKTREETEACPGICIAFRTDTQGKIKQCLAGHTDADCESGTLNPTITSQYVESNQISGNMMGGISCCTQSGCEAELPEPKIPATQAPAPTQPEQPTQSKASQPPPQPPGQSQVTQPPGHPQGSFKCLEGAGDTQLWVPVRFGDHAKPCVQCLSFDVVDSTGSTTYKECLAAGTVTDAVCANSASLERQLKSDFIKGSNVWVKFPEGGTFANFSCCSTAKCDPNPRPSKTGSESVRYLRCKTDGGSQDYCSLCYSYENGGQVHRNCSSDLPPTDCTNGKLKAETETKLKQKLGSTASTFACCLEKDCEAHQVPIQTLPHPRPEDVTEAPPPSSSPPTDDAKETGPKSHAAALLVSFLVLILGLLFAA